MPRRPNLLAAEDHRDADTWGVHRLDAAQQGLKPDYTIADARQGLRGGQKAAWGDTPCHGDVFHIICSPRSRCWRSSRWRRRSGLRVRLFSLLRNLGAAIGVSVAPSVLARDTQAMHEVIGRVG
jgi:hypothetical protein